MLAVEVVFLTGRYVATASDSRRRAEWPPHPARFFSALVATAAAPERPVEAEREVLRWLEALPPPSITASAASARELTTVFVPVNDTSVTGDVAEEAEAAEGLRADVARHEATLARGALPGTVRRALEKELNAARKALEKAERKLRDAIARETGAPARLTRAGRAQGLSVLPEHRTRQPRTFPSVTPEEPRVTFAWPEAAPSEEQCGALDGLLARLVRLGHSSSLVSARVVERAPPATWLPVEDGELTLRVVVPGQLDALEAAFALHQETEPRVMPARFQAYARPAPPLPQAAAASCFGDDWLVLRRVGGPLLPMTAGPAVARALRRTLLSYAGTGAPELLTGHAANGGPSARDHLAIVPLSFVGSIHATGLLLGVALVVPRRADGGERRAVFRAVKAWEDAARGPEDEDDEPRVPLHLGRAGVWTLQRVEARPSQGTLRAGTWCGPATTWLSASPVALDRNPGDLRSRDPAKLVRAVSEAAETVAHACARIGLPAPARVEILPAAPLAGAAKARAFAPYPDDAGKTPRVLTHVLVEFTSPVAGPLLLGAGRYVGLGLLRPRGSDA